MKCDKSVSTIILLIIVLKCQIVHTIRCYQCNSITDPECADISKHRPNEVNHFLKDCEGSYKGLHPFCRTIDLTALNDNKLSIVRTCGWELSKHQCFQGDVRMKRESVCQCFSDACNGATTITASAIGILLSAIAFIYIEIHNMIECCYQ